MFLFIITSVTALGPIELSYSMVFMCLEEVAFMGLLRNMYKLLVANYVFPPYVLLPINTACRILSTALLNDILLHKRYVLSC
jgi:hypothetical protein